MRSALDPCEQWLIDLRQKRRGVFVVIMAVSLAACLAFVAFSVDTGMVVLTQTRMQNCVDAAALAAANEIGYAVEHAGSNVQDVTAYALEQSRLKAQSVGTLNGIHIDPATDVRFGRWQLNSSTGVSSITWDVTPSNAVKVQARRTNSDTSQPDGKLKTLFAGVFGTKAVSITSSGTAYIESRDLAMALDFSSSMREDSIFSGGRPRAQLDPNMLDIYNELDAVRDFGTLPFTPAWFQQSVTSGTKNATTTFQNTSVLVAASSTPNTVLLQFSDATTESKTPTAASATYTKASGSKTITKATVTWNGTLAAATGNKTVSGKTATVTFNNSTSNVVSVTASSGLTKITLNYQGGTTLATNYTATTGTTTKTVTGSGLYVSSVTVLFGGTTVTVNNPSGTSAPSTFAKTNLVFEETAANIQASFGLPTYHWASGSWSEFFTYCQSNATISSAGYARKYGGACLVNYLVTNKYLYSQCNDLWRTPVYPFHSVKQGAMLFCDFLEDLGFGDEVGAVSYDVSTRTEQVLDYDGYSIDLSTNPVSANFESLRQIIRHRQPAHYSSGTNIGAGIRQAKLMLDGSKRAGTRPTILVMTDGVATSQDSGWSDVTSGWNWDTMFDYDGDGSADFYTTNSNERYALVRAKEAIDAGYTIHTMTVGVDGYPDLMEAIAHMGKGITITVPPTSTVSEMEEDIIAAFQRIAAFVPPARLVKPD